MLTPKKYLAIIYIKEPPPGATGDKVKMAIEIYTINQDSEHAAQIDSWSCGLWWGDFEEANIETCYAAFDGEKPVAFQTVNTDGFCTAIEVHPDYQGQGIASKLVEESGCWQPDRNENKGFWSAMEKKFGWE